MQQGPAHLCVQALNQDKQQLLTELRPSFADTSKLAFARMAMLLLDAKLSKQVRSRHGSWWD